MTRASRRLLLAALLVLVLAAGAVVATAPLRSAVPSATSVSASSSRLGHPPSAATDPAGSGWVSDGQTVGAWIQLTWPAPRRIGSVELMRGRTMDRATAGYLTFGDGSELAVVLGSDATVRLPVTTRLVDSVRFTVTAVARGATAAGVARFAAASGPAATRDPDGDAVAAARISATAGVATVRVNTSGLDVAVASGDSLDLAWSAPREVDAVSIGLAPGSAAMPTSLTLRFGDGSVVPIGAVLANPALPTVVGLLPRSTSAVRLLVDGVTGGDEVRFGRIRLAERGSPAWSSATSASTVTAADGCSAPAPQTSELMVLCPASGDRVGDAPVLVLDVPSQFNEVEVDVWPAAGGPDPPEVRVPGSGRMSVPLDLARAPAGPVSVRIQAIGLATSRETAEIQLLHRTADPGARSASSAAAAGRTPIWDEEFTRPVSISADGTGAQYAASKPGVEGVSSFGDAAFADPAAGLGNAGVLSDGVLRLTTGPLPGAGPYASLFASARPGGSGVAAQYGYFEARMLAPAMPGTWPAFWMLPTTNLVAAQPVVAEIDAIELYGHDPTGGCSSTHQFEDGKDGGIARCGVRFDSEADAARWHTYGVDIGPTRIRFFIDGREVADAPQVKGGDAPMFFMVDLALGGGWPVDLGAVRSRTQLLVDWIRVSE